ncbi:MAG: hypothetical protein A2266_06510 [Bacteroidetes bacterium RIFOXYA12_FULL_40_10]|nr:MAG: hypothetical protein A2266_06510 [Bacteroidetes bacterium RIFOXYA12_FULL_40_10]PKP07009.1 MAG: hypothetical protein CVU10_05485 [Bacteroidetes bacterium HGW-Bacteroidetes-5]
MQINCRFQYFRNLRLYDKVNIEFISPQTLTAYYKKNTFPIAVQHSYQESAAKLANYLINRQL